MAKVDPDRSKIINQPALLSSKFKVQSSCCALFGITIKHAKLIVTLGAHARSKGYVVVPCVCVCVCIFWGEKSERIWEEVRES